jgi:predicted ATPase
VVARTRPRNRRQLQECHRYRPRAKRQVVVAAHCDQSSPAVADQGRRAKAQNLLAPVYGWFTEGFGTTDFKVAKELLDELS